MSEEAEVSKARQVAIDEAEKLARTYNPYTRPTFLWHFFHESFCLAFAYARGGFDVGDCPYAGVIDSEASLEQLFKLRSEAGHWHAGRLIARRLRG
jgi:hypothetical protein